MWAKTDASFAGLATASPRSIFLPAAAGLEQEPDALLGLVDPHLEQARGRDVAVLVADRVRRAHEAREALVVVSQLGEHVERRHVVGVVVVDALERAHVFDRAQRRTAELAYALGDDVGDRVDLVGLLVEQQVVVAKMRPRHVPMEVLGLHVERKYVGEQRVQRAGDVLRCALAQAARGLKRCLATGSHGLSFHGASFLWGKGRNCAPRAGVAVKFQVRSACRAKRKFTSWNSLAPAGSS